MDAIQVKLLLIEILKNAGSSSLFNVSHNELVDIARTALEWETKAALKARIYMESLEEVASLAKWKKEAIATTPPYQEIGRLLDLEIGDSVHDKILPAIIEMQYQRRLKDKVIAELSEELYSFKERDIDRDKD